MERLEMHRLLEEGIMRWRREIGGETLMKAQSDDTYSDATNTDAHKARAKKKRSGGFTAILTINQVIRQKKRPAGAK